MSQSVRDNEATLRSAGIATFNFITVNGFKVKAAGPSGFLPPKPTFKEMCGGGSGSGARTNAGGGDGSGSAHTDTRMAAATGKAGDAGGTSDGGGGDIATGDLSLHNLTHLMTTQGSAYPKHVSTTTHFMYGNLYGLGRLNVGKDRLPELAACVVSDWHNGWFMAMTENNPASAVSTRMYFDYDMEFKTRAPDADEWSRLWVAVEVLEKKVLHAFFMRMAQSNQAFRSVVCVSGFKYAPKSSGSGSASVATVTQTAASSTAAVSGGHPGHAAVSSGSSLRTGKTGIHVIYPNLFVPIATARAIATALRYLLKKELPDAEHMFGIDWDSVVDTGVYAQGRGLRWTWQTKAVNCPFCTQSVVKSTAFNQQYTATEKTSATPTCRKCFGVGCISDPVASMYHPLYIADGAVHTFEDGCVEDAHGVDDSSSSSRGSCQQEFAEFVHHAALPNCRSTPTKDLLLATSLLYQNDGRLTQGYTGMPIFAPATDVPCAVKIRSGGGGTCQSASGSLALYTMQEPSLDATQEDLTTARALGAAAAAPDMLGQFPSLTTPAAGSGDGGCGAAAGVAACHAASLAGMSSMAADVPKSSPFNSRIARPSGKDHRDIVSKLIAAAKSGAFGAVHDPLNDLPDTVVVATRQEVHTKEGEFYTLPCSDPRVSDILALLRTLDVRDKGTGSLCYPYMSLTSTDVTVKASAQRFMVGTKWRLCCVARRNHETASVHFSIACKTVTQRCFAQSCGGQCVTWDVPYTFQKKLFPGVVTDADIREQAVSAVQAAAPGHDVHKRRRVEDVDAAVDTLKSFQAFSAGDYQLRTLPAKSSISSLLGAAVIRSK
jgi:hypothetical protein